MSITFSSIIERNGGQAPLTYNQFQAIVASMDSPQMAESVMTPEQIQNSNTPIDEDHDEKYGVPTLYELGTFLSLFNNSCILTCNYLHIQIVYNFGFILQ